ncbi:MAG: DUF5615 family PIN-like protein [Planctomycetota bacterium]
MNRPVKFYTDEHVSRAVVRGLRERGVDVVTVPESGMLGESDEAHLTWAHREGRVVFSQDQDFLRLHAAGVEHSGIAFIRQEASVGEVIRGLMLIHQLLDADDMLGHVEFLS